jgi:hypothetical protein
MEMIPDPERVSEFLAPLQGAEQCSPLSGGLRSASTTGYYLAALLAEMQLRPFASLYYLWSRSLY